MPTDGESGETVQRVYEATGESFDELLDGVLAEDVVLHDPHLAVVRGRDRVLEYYGAFHDAFPDVAFTVDDLFEAGDRVTVRWTAEGTHEGEFWGVAATGNPVHLSGIDVVRVADGEFREVWTVYDSATLLRQLGVELPIELPSPES